MEDIVAIVSIFIILPSIVIGGIVKMREAKYKALESSGGSEMRMSDLRRMIEDAVEEAIEPLHDRIELLEAQFGDDPVGDARLDPAVLADALDDPEADLDDPAAVRRRTRS